MVVMLAHFIWFSHHKLDFIISTTFYSKNTILYKALLKLIYAVLTVSPLIQIISIYESFGYKFSEFA